MASNFRTQRKANPLPVILVLVIVGLLGFGAYYFNKTRTLEKQSSRAADAVQAKTVDEVGQIYELPAGEKPVVLVVTDEATFKKEYAVFTGAKKDDALLLYQQTGLAILYRPSVKKLVATSPFTVAQTPRVALIASPTEQASTEKVLKDKLKDALKVTAKQAPLGTFSTTQVIDVSGKNAPVSKAIAEAIGGTVVASLPPSEDAPKDIDVVIVVANKPGATLPQPQPEP